MLQKFFGPLTLAVVATSIPALAEHQTPGSLLVFPCFDNTRSASTLFTVTNTNDDATLGSNGLANGTIDVEFVYINGDNCLETNRTRRLTPNDTLTVVASVDNPNAVRGYVYVFAKRNGAAVSFNHLTGASLTFSGQDNRDFELAPISFQAVSNVAGTPTDVDADGLRDLNGTEYVKVPDKLIIPRFLGQPEPNAFLGLNLDEARSQLVLINLTGARFTTVVDFLVYNDNEEVFSAQYTIDCWDRVWLTDINAVFSDDFLEDFTNHNPNEIDAGSISSDVAEQGWFRMDGLVANSTAASVENPAILAALIESIEGDGGAQLPWGLGEQGNGDLLNRSILADGN
ncbi:MAG: hypothetical protein HZA53_16260 [Planctomycetes bacterium]|nr:hypothetical protein [Planctomycetota bacterium]